MVCVLLTDSISKLYCESVNLKSLFQKRKTAIRQLDEKYPGLGSEINNGASPYQLTATFIRTRL